jgi:hypothetical protein
MEITKGQLNPLIFYVKSELTTPYYLLSFEHTVTGNVYNYEPTNLADDDTDFYRVQFDFTEPTDLELPLSGDYELRLYDQQASGTDVTNTHSLLKKVFLKVLPRVEDLVTTNSLVYAENLQGPNEWSYTEAGGGTVNMDNTAGDPFGLYSIEASGTDLFNFITFTVPTGTIDTNIFTKLQLRIKSQKQWVNTVGEPQIAWTVSVVPADGAAGGGLVSDSLSDFDSSNTTDWQTVELSLTAGKLVTEVLIHHQYDCDCYIDNIKFVR